MYKRITQEKTPEELDQILTKPFLQEWYVDKKWPIYKIAKMVGCSEPTVRSRLVRLGFYIRTQNEVMKGKYKGIKFTIEHKLNMSLARKGKPNSEEHNKNISKATKGKPKLTLRGKKQSEEHIRKRLNKIQASPNNFEIKCLEHLNQIYPNKFKYVGDGALVVNSRSADAYSEELKTVALFHGYYWHLLKNKLEITEENKRAVEKIDSLPFLAAGYKVMFIWEDEINKILEYKNAS